MLTKFKKGNQTSVSLSLVHSDAKNIDKFLNGSSTLLEGRAFVVGEADLDYLLDAVFAEFDRDADEKIVDSVFAFEKNGAGQDLFLVL